MSLYAWNLGEAKGFKILKTRMPCVYRVEQMDRYFYIFCTKVKLKITEPF